MGFLYNFYRRYSFSGNINYNNIKELDAKDIFVTGFNTPFWSTNIAFSNREIFKNIGFAIAWKWQDSYVWESPLVNGNIPAFQTIDAQVSFHLPSVKSQLKIGGANILNTRHIEYAGGPTIGAIYYIAATMEGLFNH
jgi:hypothetical protein